MRIHVRRRARRDDRGAAAVEFALVVPVLLMVVFGIINYGVVFAQQISLNNAARQGVRFGVVDGRDCTQIQNETRDAVATLGMPAASPAVTITRNGSPAPCPRPCAGSAPGDSIKVQLTYTSNLLVPMPPFPNSINLSGAGVMRCEFS